MHNPPIIKPETIEFREKFLSEYARWSQYPRHGGLTTLARDRQSLSSIAYERGTSVAEESFVAYTTLTAVAEETLTLLCIQAVLDQK